MTNAKIYNSPGGECFNTSPLAFRRGMGLGKAQELGAGDNPLPGLGRAQVFSLIDSLIKYLITLLITLLITGCEKQRIYKEFRGNRS